VKGKKNNWKLKRKEWKTPKNVNEMSEWVVKGKKK
jgi:hypothetical protein